MSKRDEIERRIAELRAAVARQRALPDQPSCVETALLRDLDAAMAERAALKGDA